MSGEHRKRRATGQPEGGDGLKAAALDNPKGGCAGQIKKKKKIERT